MCICASTCASVPDPVLVYFCESCHRPEDMLSAVNGQQRNTRHQLMAVQMRPKHSDYMAHSHTSTLGSLNMPDTDFHVDREAGWKHGNNVRELKSYIVVFF